MESALPCMKINIRKTVRFGAGWNNPFDLGDYVNVHSYEMSKFIKITTNKKV